MRRTVSLLSATVGLAALCMPQVAWAQDENEAGEPVRTGQLEEIVVTAQKRSESLQNAPVAITAVESETLVARGISDIRGVANLVPSARFNVESNATQVFIRGVGSSLDVSAIPEGVGIQYNGIYLARFATSSGLFDVDRIEVLPGPQGTLYGRSAIGGIVNISARRPEFAHGMNALLEVGNYDSVHFSGAANVPLSDTVAIRGAFDIERHDGYDSIGTDNKDAIGGRFSLLAEPSPTASIYLWGQYYRNDYITARLAYVPGKTGGDLREMEPIDPLGNSYFFYGGLDPLAKGFNDFETYSFGGQIDLELGGLAVSYLPGYVKHKEQSHKDIAGLVQQTLLSGEHYSNELRFSNANPGALDWLVGLYQYHNSQPYAYTFGPYELTFGPNAEEPVYPWLAGSDYVTNTDIVAGFGQATYSLTDALRLTVGGRYSWERLKLKDGAIAIYPIFAGDGSSPTHFQKGVAPISYRDSWKRFDWKVGLEADVGAESLIYGNVQTGFNPGTFKNETGEPMKPQKMLGFTAGTKNRLAGNTIQANLELFYYRYTDQLVQQYNAATGGFLLFNADRTRMYGAELDTIFSVSDNTRLNVKASYLSAKIKKFSDNPALEGNDLPFAPEVTILAGLEHSVPFASGGELKFRVDTAYNSGYWDSFDNAPVLKMDDFTKTDANVTYTLPGENLEFGIWVRNLENEHVHAAAAQINDFDPAYGGAVFLEPPRTYGARIRATF